MLIEIDDLRRENHELQTNVRDTIESLPKQDTVRLTVRTSQVDQLEGVIANMEEDSMNQQQVF